MSKKPKPRNVVAYARACCKKQNESSVDNQLDRIRDWVTAQKLPWKIAIFYRDDSNGIVNAIDDIRKMLDERNITATIIVAESACRFGRDQKWLRSELLDDFSFASVLDLIIPAD